MSSTTALVWGNNNENLLSETTSQCLTKPQQIHFSYQILKLCATQKHISFITTNGDVYSYGANTDGRLGIGGKDNFSCLYHSPMKMRLEGKAREIKAGFSHTILQLQNNDIYAWGLGEYGSLGVGEFRSKYSPTKVLLPPMIREFSCGAMHSAFVDFNGSLYMCGSNEYGQLGVKSPDKIGTPILVPFQFRVKQVACGVFYTLILTEDGDVYGMGNNKYAQLGLGHKINESKPTLIVQLENIVQIQAGYHSAALNSMCELYLWGSGSFGELVRPKKFVLNCPLSSLIVRGFFGMAMSESQNRVFIWGNNTHGQLGNGGYISLKSPTEIKQLSHKKIDKICCGVNFAIVLLQNDAYERKSYQSTRVLENKRYAYGIQHRGNAYEERTQYHERRVGDSYQRRGYEEVPYHSTGRTVENFSREQSPVGALSVYRRGRQLQRSPRQNLYDDQQSNRRRQEIQESSAKKSIHYKQSQERDRSRSIIKGDRVKEVQNDRNYQQLFRNLSKDYQTLAINYKELQGQIQQRETRREIKSTSMKQQEESQQLKQAKEHNERLKDEIFKISKQFTITKEQLSLSKEQIEENRKELIAKRQELIKCKQEQERIRRDQTLSKEEYKICTEDLKACRQELKACREELKISRQEVKISRQEAKICRQEVRISRQQEKKTVQELLICRQDLQVALHKIQQLQKQLQYLQLRQLQLIRAKSPIKSPTKSPTKSPIKLIESKKQSQNEQLQQQNDHLLKVIQEKQEEIKHLHEEIAMRTKSMEETKYALKTIEEQMGIRLEHLEQENALLKSELQSQKLFSCQIQAKYKTICLKESELAKINQAQRSESTGKKGNVQEIDSKMIEHFKHMLLQKQGIIMKMELERDTLKDQLQEQKLFAKDIESKYKVISTQLQQTYSENTKLREQMLKSQDRIGQFEKEMKTKVPQKQFQTVHKELVEKKGKLKELQETISKGEISMRRQKQTNAALQEERMRLYNMIEEMKNIETENKQISEKKIEEQRQKASQLQTKAKQLETQIKYEKQYSLKLSQKSTEMDRLRAEACQQIIKVTQLLQKQKKRKKQLQKQVQEKKIVEGELNLAKQQLQKERQLNEQYKQSVLKEYKKKDQLLKQIQQELNEKESELIELNELRENDNSKLKEQIAKVSQKLALEKQQTRKLNKELNLKQQQIQNLSDEVSKFQRKLKHSGQIIEKEIQQRQTLVEEVSVVRREQTKTQLEKQQLQKHIKEVQQEKSDIEKQLRRSQKMNNQLQRQIEQYKQRIQSLSQQSSHMRTQLIQANTATQQANRISQQLSQANKEFAQHEEELNKKIQELESKVYELQDENQSYTPRYDALMERNQQLDRRNKELSEMVNKAIQIQAQTYKDNILKEVEFSTNQIIDEVEDQKIFKQKQNRKPLQNSPEHSRQHQNQDHSFSQQPQIVSRVKQEPYTKFMQEKISTHRKRVSDSAQKLAGILDLQSGIGSGFNTRRSSIYERKSNIQNANDQQLERINNHMESLRSQKQAFMEKINSFASKMKLL